MALEANFVRPPRHGEAPRLALAQGHTDGVFFVLGLRAFVPVLTAVLVGRGQGGVEGSDQITHSRSLVREMGEDG